SDIQPGRVLLTEKENRTSALAHLAVAIAILGRLDEAISRCAQALAAGRAGRPYTLAVALWAASTVTRFRGAEQIALQHLSQLNAIAREQRFPLFLAAAGLHGAVHLSERGETTEGLARARQAFAYWTAIGAANGAP